LELTSLFHDANALLIRSVPPFVTLIPEFPRFQLMTDGNVFQREPLLFSLSADDASVYCVTVNALKALGRN
jgi:hypothetical protein